MNYHSSSCSVPGGSTNGTVQNARHQNHQHPMQNSAPNSTSTPSFLTTQPQESSPPSSTARVVEESPAASSQPSIDAKHLLAAPCNAGGGATNSLKFPPPRRSSVVVIPPMQVCPGDLLVYSKALTHRGNLQGMQISHECGGELPYLTIFFRPCISELDGSTQSLANEQGK